MPRPTVRLPHHCFTEWVVTGFDICFLSPECHKKRPALKRGELSHVTPTVCRQGVGASWSRHIHGSRHRLRQYRAHQPQCQGGWSQDRARQCGHTRASFTPPGSPGSAWHCPGSPLMPMCFRNATHGFLGMTFRNADEAGREFQGLCGGGGLGLAGPTVPFHTSQSCVLGPQPPQPFGS